MVFNKISSSQERDISPMTFQLLLCLSFLDEYYIGLNDVNKTGTYRWVDGTNASFTNWKTGQLQDNDKKYGVVIKMKRDSDYGKWETKDSKMDRRFICECPDGPCARQ